MAQGNITGKDIDDLVQRTAEANAALMHGNIGGYLALIKHAEDYTLMAPFGGAPTRKEHQRGTGGRDRPRLIPRWCIPRAMT